MYTFEKNEELATLQLYSHITQIRSILRHVCAVCYRVSMSSTCIVNASGMCLCVVRRDVCGCVTRANIFAVVNYTCLSVAEEYDPRKTVATQPVKQGKTRATTVRA